MQEQRPGGTKEPDKGIRREQCSCRWNSQGKGLTVRVPPVAIGALRAVVWSEARTRGTGGHLKGDDLIDQQEGICLRGK